MHSKLYMSSLHCVGLVYFQMYLVNMTSNGYFVDIYRFGFILAITRRKKLFAYGVFLTAAQQINMIDTFNVRIGKLFSGCSFN